MATNKFRPVLSSQQISYLIDLIASDSREATSKIQSETFKYMKLFQAKCNLGIVAASHSTAETKLSIADRLGDSETPAERRKAAYNLWKLNPSLCSADQYFQAQTYRYENDLMSPEEEESFESEKI